LNPARKTSAAGKKIKQKPERYLYRGHRTLSIMPTYTCPAACTDCGTLSTPQERTRLDVEYIIAAIDEAKELGFFNVVFTGGEATLRWHDLLPCIGHARSLGFPVRLVTNAHWATDLEMAREKLAELIDAGLSEINYSTGDEHVRFVSIERVAYATVAACERAFRVHVMVEMKKDNTILRDSLLQHPLVAALSDEQRQWLTVVPSPWMPLSPSTVHRYPAGSTTTRRNLAMRPGCESVLQTYTVQADGNVGSCCGLGLRVIPELNVERVEQPGFLRRAIAESEEDFLKLWIHYFGPEQIVAWAAKHNPNIKWEGLYAHRCQVCQRLYHDDAVRTVIREHWEEVVAEVLQAAWLDEVHVPTTMGELWREGRAAENSTAENSSITPPVAEAAPSPARL
jgi:organic radical activating enzyme